MNDGLLRWLLRECVRANPLYVISALLIMYGLFELNHEIDQKGWQTGAHLSAYALLQFYEASLLVVATVVLRRRRKTVPGMDCHGLMIVVAIFLSGSFLAQDELVAQGLGWSALLVPLSLVLAWAKITWYARLPGIYLPLPFQRALLAVIMAHTLGSLWGLLEITALRKAYSMQSLAWLLGWLSLMVIFFLIHYGYASRTASQRANSHSNNLDGETRRRASGPGFENRVHPDPLTLPRCGFTAIGIATVLGMAHLVACDWVFDRPLAAEFCAPALVILAASFALHRHRTGRGWSKLSMYGRVAPAMIVEIIWWNHPPWASENHLAAVMSPASQVGLAATLAYTGLAWSTRRWSFLWGLSAPVTAPVWSGLANWKNRIPFFASIVSVAIGFTALFFGMLVSIYRDLLLKKLQSAQDNATGLNQDKHVQEDQSEWDQQPRDPR